MEKLSEFLVKAKKATYAGDGKGKLLKDGCKELTYSEGDLKYIDRYYGNNPFSGHETLFKNKKAIWSMNYYGKTKVGKLTSVRVFKFLKKSIGFVNGKKPFRGPAKFKEGNFEYTDKSVGDLELFRGVEKIFYKSEEIYKLYYHGGFIKR